MRKYYLVAPQFFSKMFEIIGKCYYPALSKKFLKEIICGHIIDIPTNTFIVDIKKMAAIFEVNRVCLTGVMKHFLQRDIFRIKEKDTRKGYTCMINPLFFRKTSLNIDELISVYKKIPVVKKVGEVRSNNPKYTKVLKVKESE